MARKTLTRYYWDSCTFLAWLLPEPDRKDQCQEVLEEAELGECAILTSAITLTEVIKLKGHPPLKEKQEEKIQRFFQQDYIHVRGLDRFVAEEARRLIWAEGIKPKDSIHLATALRWNAEEFHTFDGELCSLDGKHGNPALVIREPAAKQRRILTSADTMDKADGNIDDTTSAGISAGESEQPSEEPLGNPQEAGAEPPPPRTSSPTDDQEPPEQSSSGSIG